MFSHNKTLLGCALALALTGISNNAGSNDGIDCANPLLFEEQIIVGVGVGRSVTFCEAFYYFTANTPEGGRAQALARPGAIHYGIENIAVISSLAEMSDSTTEVDTEALAWRIEDAVARKKMNAELARLVDAKASEIDIEVLAREYYSAHKEEFTEPATVDVDHILIKAEGRGYSEALRQIETLRTRVLNGEDFRDLAAQESEDDSVAMNRGRLGKIKRGQTYPTFEKAAFLLTEKGEISEPVFSIFGIHLIRLNERVPAKLLPFEQVTGKLKPKLLKEAKIKLREQIFDEQRAALALKLTMPEEELFKLFTDAFAEAIPL